MWSLIEISRRSSWALWAGIGIWAMALLAAPAITAQSGDRVARVLEVKKSTMQQEADRLAAAGFDIVLAFLQSTGFSSNGLLVAQQNPEPVQRSYRFAEKLQPFLAGGQLEAGYRLLPQTLSRVKKTMGLDEDFCAVFEKAAGDQLAREYVFLRESSAGDLEKKARKISKDLVPIAIDINDTAAGVFERRLDAWPWKLLATKKTATMREELAAAAAEGYRIAASSGGAELVYALVRPPGGGPVEYRLLGTSSSETLEREMNASVAQGYRLVASSLLGPGGSRSFSGDSAVLVMEHTRPEAPVTYKVVAARQFATIEREVSEATALGFRMVAATVGYQETVIVLVKPGDGATTTVP